MSEWTDEIAHAAKAFASMRKHHNAHVTGFVAGVLWEHDRCEAIGSHLKKILAYCKGGDPCGGTKEKPCTIHEHEEARAALAIFEGRRAPTTPTEKQGGGNGEG